MATVRQSSGGTSTAKKTTPQTPTLPKGTKRDQISSSIKDQKNQGVKIPLPTTPTLPKDVKQNQIYQAILDQRNQGGTPSPSPSGSNKSSGGGSSGSGSSGSGSSVKPPSNSSGGQVNNSSSPIPNIINSDSSSNNIPYTGESNIYGNTPYITFDNNNYPPYEPINVNYPYIENGQGMIDYSRFDNGYSMNYDQYRGTTPAPYKSKIQSTQDYLKQMLGQLDTYYTNTQAALLERLKASLNRNVSELEGQKIGVEPLYQGYKNQANFQANKDLQGVKEFMARQGLFNGGDNISAQIAVNTGNQQNLANIDLQKQNYINDIDRKIQVLKESGASEENALVKELLAEKTRALMDLYGRADERELRLDDTRYNRYRDEIGDERYERQWNYGLDRDQLADYKDERSWDYNLEKDRLANERYNQEWNYGLERDKVADQRYNQEWSYNVGRDKVADQRYTNEWNYNVNRDNVADQRYNQEWNYNVGRDKVADQRYGQEWNYNVGRDKVADQRYSQEWNYNVGRDKVADNHWQQEYNLSKENANRSSGSSSSGSSSSSDGFTQNQLIQKAWSEYYNILEAGGVNGAQKATEWLTIKRTELIQTIGVAEYQKMLDDLAEHDKSFENKLKITK